jgi:hypothetical protein
MDCIKFDMDWRVRAYALEEILLIILNSSSLSELGGYMGSFAKFLLN